MKKILSLLVLILILGFNVNALENKINVTLDACVDGDTAKFVTSKGSQSIRFLAIDTPEYTTQKEDFGKDASDFTCNYLTNAKEIILELDPNSSEYDKYNRLLAWIWVDGLLLQDELVKAGLAEVTYLYGDYKYTDLLKDHEAIAKTDKLNIWSNENTVIKEEDAPEKNGNNTNTDSNNEINKDANDIVKKTEDFGIYDLMLLISFGMTILVSRYYRKHKNANLIINNLLKINNQKLILLRLALYFAYVYSIFPPVIDIILIILSKYNSKSKA